MIIKRIKDILNTDRDIEWGNVKSLRLLLQSDKLPFTVTETTVNAGTESKLQYPSHIEACYCIEGEGEVESGGKVYDIKPGTLYAPQNDKHILRAKKDLKLICIFNPPLSGDEQHDLSTDGFSKYSKKD